MTNVIFFGNERLVSGLEKTDAPLLRGLIARGYNVLAVVSHHSVSTSRNKRSLEVADIAKEHSIPVLLPNRPTEIINELRAFKADIAVLAAYGRIISQEIIDIFPFGIVNIHPSLLPKYRGPTPIESAILYGDKTTGVSIMQLTAGMDEGPVYVQKSLAVDAHEDKLDLYSKLSGLATELLFDTLPSIIDESLHPVAQNGEPTYSKLIEKSVGVINWHTPAIELERQIRAYQGWPGSRTTLGDVDVIITKAAVIDRENDEPGKLVINQNRLYVATSNQWLELVSLKPLGKKEMPVQAFLAGYRSKIDL